MTIPFDNSFIRLPDRFYAVQDPTPVAAPAIIRVNGALAAELGIDPVDLDVAVLSGSRVPIGAEPIAMAYAGHQFGNFVPQLGDGRAVLLGEVAGYDIALKGSGPTPFSRNGDGRAAIGPVIREYVLSEAMHALGIPTTRALAAVTTGERVQRETALDGAVITRVASSHIRVGTFQYHYAKQDVEALRLLTDHVIARHYPEVADTDQPELALLAAVIKRQAELVAKWMRVGFIHGVMNTDNMAISGETIDYGPCAFTDDFHPETVFSSIDRRGRYAWGKQPQIAHWNLSQFAQCLLPLIPDGLEAAQKVLNGFDAEFTAAFNSGFSRKIGVTDNPALVEEMLKMLAAGGVDFTLFFSNLTRGADHARAMLADTTEFDVWADKWHMASVDVDIMRAANPVYIPRNHRLQQVISAAETGDYGSFETLMDVLAKPFEARAEYAEYEQAPTADEIVHATFCGT